MTKIQELEQKVKELSEELEQLKKQEKVVSSRFIPEIGDEYWYVSSLGEIYNCNWENSKFNQYKIANTPLFRTEEEAKRYLEFKKELAKRRWLVTEEEWEDDNILKYYIEMEKDEIAVEFGNVYRKVGTIYFKTRDDAQYMVDNFEDILRMELI